MLCAKYIVFLSYVKFFFCKTFIFPRVDTTPCFCGMSCLPPPGKFHAFYWSIKDYGQAGLCREDLWFTTCCLRSNKVNLLDGGLSALTREVVALFDRFKSGVLLTFLSGWEFLFGSVSVLVGDEGALKSMYAVKGASGTIPCIFCWNVVQARSTLADHDETWPTCKPPHLPPTYLKSSVDLMQTLQTQLCCWPQRRLEETRRNSRLWSSRWV